MLIVVMGPAGAGKSTMGAALADALRWTFVDADAFHPAANLSKLSRGEPLTDADRAGWLASLHDVLARAADRREPIVLACSALTAAHRAHLVGTLRGVRFAYLEASPEVLRQRLNTRLHHIAGANLLESQLATLEAPDDPALTFDAELPVDELVGRIRHELGV